MLTQLKTRLESNQSITKAQKENLFRLLSKLEEIQRKISEHDPLPPDVIDEYCGTWIKFTESLCTTNIGSEKREDLSLKLDDIANLAAIGEAGLGVNSCNDPSENHLLAPTYKYTTLFHVIHDIAKTIKIQYCFGGDKIGI